MTPNFQPTTDNRRELRKFGLLVGGIFALLFGLLLPWWLHRPRPLWPWCLAVPLFFFALVAPLWLKIPHRLWTLLGEGLHWVNTRIVLSLLFFAVFTPIGLLLRLFGRDPLSRGFEGECATYRSVRPEGTPPRMERPY
jgi:hypothetical protein